MTARIARRLVFVVALATMVVAGRWLLLEADVPQVAAGTWVSAGDLGAIPDAAASASLADGRLVIAGGRTADGTLVSQVGIYDPATQSWEDGGQLAMARADHTATALTDGRVLFAGGRTVNGVTFDVEIYNPNTKQSAHVGDLWARRVNHAAAELKNGLVLIVGGSDGSVVVDYVELFDPGTGQTQSLVTRLIESREKATATTLLDGHVLIAGGRNETGTLATAEIFDSGSHSVFPTGPMRAARSGHVAVLLPNNNQVLIAGGTVSGAPTASAELYADWRDGFTVVPNAMAQARTGAVGGPLPRHDLGFVAGGGAGTGEFFGYATVKTDKDDYAPGEPVVITGSGWQPGEKVSIKISEDADTDRDFDYESVADQQGNITNAQFAPIEDETIHHIGMRFYVAVQGAASQALNTFTDAPKVTGVYLDAQTPNPVTQGSSATYGVSITTNTNANAATTVAFSIVAGTTAVPAGVSVTPASLGVGTPQSASPAKCVSGRGVPPGEKCYDSFNVSISTTTLTPPGTYGLKLRGSSAGNDSAEGAFTLVVEGAIRPTSTSVSCVPNPVAVNAATTCTASVSDTGSGAQVAPAGTVSFTGNGSGTFSAASCTLTGSSSPMSCAVDYTPTARGTGTHAITGSYSPTSSHSSSSNSAAPFNLTVNKAPQATLNLSTPATLVYGTTGTASTTGGSGTGAVTFSAGASNGCSVNPTTGEITVSNASGNCVISAEKATDDDYLVATAGPNTVTLQKADASVTVTGYSGTYDGASHGATGTATGVGGADLSSQLNLGSGFTDYPGGPANWTFSGGNNYVDESGSVQIVINKADAVVTVTGYTGTYDAAPHGATGTATGVGGVSLLGLSLGATFTDYPGGTANWTFNGGINYLYESGSVAIVINKADANVTVTGYPGTYDGAAHGATGSAKGVGNVDLSDQLDLGASFTDVPGGTAHWTFSGGTNYLNESGEVSIVIEKADAAVSVTGYSGTYDGAAHGATGSATGVGGVDLSSQLSLGDTFTDAPGGTAHWTFSGGTNYLDESGDVSIVINKADADVTVNGYTGVYDAAPHGATGSATGVGDVDLSGQLNLGASFTDVPGGTANWTFTGGTNYNDQYGSVAIIINKADALVTVNGFTGTYDALPHSPTGTATGVGGVDLSAQLDLSASFTDVPGGTANWTFTGGTNYNDQYGSVAIIINKADANVTVSGYSGVYDAQAHGATGTATGVSGVALPGLDLGASFTDVPGGTANWTFTGGTNYNNQSGSVPIAISKADANVTVSGYSDFYDAQPHGATGTATGVNGVALPGLDLGASFTDVPGGTATWTFTGGTNYEDESGEVQIVIKQATADIVVTPYDVTYDAVAHTSVGTATGVASLDLSSLLDVSGTTHTDAGDYADAWTFAGNTNYKPLNGVVANKIRRATPTITITWADSVYNGNPNAASATVNGIAGQMNLSPAATLLYYAGATAYGVPLGGAPTDAGTYTVKASFAGNGNYTDKDATKTITIQRANQAITFGALGNKTFGDPPVPVSATGGASGNPVTFSTQMPAICSVAPGVANAATVTILAVGLCTVRASQAESPNYNAAPDVDQSFSVAAWTANGFHQPVGIPNSVFAPAGTEMLVNPPAGAWNSAKGGSTIPLKFNVFAAGVEKTSTADILGFFARTLTSCNGAAEEDDLAVFDTAGSTVLRYDGVAGSGQFIQNWKTPAVRGEQCYRVEVKFRDASSLYTFVKLKK